MSNLLSSLISSAGALRALDRSLSTVQNNVSNSTTPGYAKQRQSLIPMIFDPALGFPGGVLPGKLISYRNAYAERAVRREKELIGYSSERADVLSGIEPYFDVSGDSGIPAAITEFFQSVSALSVAPNSMTARRLVLDSAGDLAASFNQAAANLRGSAYSVEQQIRAGAARINELASQIRDINLQRRNNVEAATAAGPDAQLHTALENLAELVDFTALEQDDGTVSVLVGGQTPLVIGENLYEIQADFSAGTARILDHAGQDISGKIQRGRLAALVEAANTTIPGFLADLDRLAAALADRVNALLAEGVDAAGSMPAKDLFVYSDQPAVTLAVTDILPEELAAALPEAPGGNGNALRLAELAGSKEVDGLTFTEFYGAIAGRLGRDLTSARNDESLHADLLAQAKEIRETLQGVSLDEEAVHLIQFQRAYQACAQYLTVINELTETVIQLI